MRQIKGLKAILSSRAAGDGKSLTIEMAGEEGPEELEIEARVVADLISTLLVGSGFLKPPPQLHPLSPSQVDVLATPHGAALSLEIPPGVQQMVEISSDALPAIRDALEGAIQFSVVGRVQ
ncbi:hypothetical protein DEM27_05650 [Metarhizobium album]|uniref:Uncharacterized protein n=1 Tax=Metarhizobium album TaxID=2182425 RepID=A0A2U2DV04_9HYPH|nr:hypothetical protein [Rhizobium album]PWE57126.1 hypothetical protein DEM27_05650 [Rhizobium album]